LWSRLRAFARNVETMPQKVDDIHSALCASVPAAADSHKAMKPTVKEQT
jgi:hypothetical protein